MKLTDNSLSRDLFPQDYHCLGDRENRPIKWMSIETLTKKQFSEASDAWAFGVLIWELCTLARQPYIDVSRKFCDSNLFQFVFASFHPILPLWNLCFLHKILLITFPC